jgi:DNA replication protein DnaC
MTTRSTIASAPPLPAELEDLLRKLRLPHIRRHAPEVVATAKAQRWEPAEVLKALFAEEVAGRERSALATRRAAAGFPTGKTFDAWHPEVSSIPAPTQQALRTLEWVHRRENLVVCGPSGTGKTFLLEALGQQAVEQGLKVAWFTLEDLGVLLRRHRADDTVTKAIARVLRADVVVVDDIGLLPVAADGAGTVRPEASEAAYQDKPRRETDLGKPSQCEVPLGAPHVIEPLSIIRHHHGVPACERSHPDVPLPKGLSGTTVRVWMMTGATLFPRMSRPSFAGWTTTCSTGWTSSGETTTDSSASTTTSTTGACGGSANVTLDSLAAS